MIKALIVDDEPLARDAVRVRLEDEADVSLAGEASDGPDAVEKITALLPDLLFLDVQMPEMNGFEVLDAVASRHLPVVIFVSAHDRFAVKAFEAHALDYLLKPFSRERFQEAVRRARSEIDRGEDRETPERMAALLETVHRGSTTGRGPITRFVVKESSRFLLIPAADVEWIESAGNYAQIHAGGRRHLVRETMKELEARLDPEKFARIHRSAIVNIERVREIRPDASGDYDVVLTGDIVVRMSRTYRGNLLPS